jgi:murein DD-endopeptidase MepM/ murein hydrolase activator NlpD
MMWPIPSFWIIDTGESVLKKRAHKNQPHFGVDIHCHAGTPVLAAAAGTVIAVVDGRKSSKAETRAAGLFVEIDDTKDYIFRYLHLGECEISVGQNAAEGLFLGTVADAHTSGLGNRPHLHFEIRRRTTGGGIGAAVDPLRLLPARRA